MIEHLKSGLSISTHVGCMMGCKYCVLSKMKDFCNGPILVKKPRELVGELYNGRNLFCDGITPIMINNRTDPFLPMVKNDTIELLELLYQNNTKSPIIIISKFAPPVALKAFFERLHIIYIYSYSNIKDDFNYGRLEADLEIIKKVVPSPSRFHYFRPIIEGINDNIDEMTLVIKEFSVADFRGSIINGLRVTPNNIGLLKDNKIYDKQHKLLDKTLFERLIKKLNNEGFDYKIFRHTSCAVSTFFNRQNKLLYFGEKGHCSECCENYELCSNSSENVDVNIILSDLKEKRNSLFDMTYADGNLHVLSPITQEEVAYIKNVYGVKVLADNIILAPSEKEILEE